MFLEELDPKKIFCEYLAYGTTDKPSFGNYGNIFENMNHPNGYNNTKHSSTKFAPNDVNDNNEQIVRNNLFPKVIKESKYLAKNFKVGDTVRISTKKSIFQKGYDQTYSYEVFTINEVKDTYPVTYGLRDYKGNLIDGSFYTNELQAVDVTNNIWPVEKILNTRFRGGKTEYLVKFQGYPDEANNWIPQEDLFD